MISLPDDCSVAEVDPDRHRWNHVRNNLASPCPAIMIQFSVDLTAVPATLDQNCLRLSKARGVDGVRSTSYYKYIRVPD